MIEFSLKNAWSPHAKDWVSQGLLISGAWLPQNIKLAHDRRAVQKKIRRDNFLSLSKNSSHLFSRFYTAPKHCKLRCLTPSRVALHSFPHHNNHFPFSSTNTTSQLSPQHKGDNNTTAIASISHCHRHNAWRYPRRCKFSTHCCRCSSVTTVANTSLTFFSVRPTSPGPGSQSRCH